MVTDYAQLAKRISATTTNCLLTAVVLVAGLGFGRQVLRWWAADTGESADASRPAQIADGLGDPWRLHVLQFGERPWSIRRQSIGGGKQAAAAALREVCREVVRQDRPLDQRPGEAEGNFLRRLAAREPAEQEPGGWRLYELSQAFPMVVGTQPQAGATDSPPGENLAAVAHRVVVWGLALPVGPEAWTVLTFQPEVRGGQQPVPLPEVPIPPGCRRTLSMRVADGGGTLGFVGPQEPKAWIAFYDRWFATHTWKRAGAWQQLGSGWHARYTMPEEGQTHPSGGTGKMPRQWDVDVHFGSDGPGRSTGLLMMTPFSSGRRN